MTIAVVPHKDIGVDEPAEIADRQEDRPEALVEMAAGDDVHADDTLGGALGGNDIALGVTHHRNASRREWCSS